MRKLYALTIFVAAWLFAGATMATPPERGTITTLSPDRDRWNISIDTRDLTITEDTVIRYLGDRGDGHGGLQLKQQVRYRTDEDGNIIILWVYPSDSRERGRLGYGSGSRGET